MEPRPRVILLILDGVGIGQNDAFDAVAHAHTPNLDRLASTEFSRTLRAHGRAVGLADETEMGNSEVGHNIMGAGRVVPQGSRRVQESLDTLTIWDGEWKNIIASVKEDQGTLHFLGLLSDGNVHSHISHLEALLSRAMEDGIGRTRIHVLLDGRDVADRSAELYLARLERFLDDIAAEAPWADFAIASGGGRMTTTMDRYESDWSIVERGWQAHVCGIAPGFPSATEAVRVARMESPGVSDQDLPPFTIVDEDHQPIGAVRNGDGMIFFNFRGDRAIQFSTAMEADGDFDGFDRGNVPDVTFAGMTLYDAETNTPKRYLVAPEVVPSPVSKILGTAMIRQYACAETHKFGHVTYFWNGNRTGMIDGLREKYEEIRSFTGSVALRPWMKSAETAIAIIGAISSGKWDFIRANFAGGDMVGHTGKFDSTVLALSAIDLAIGEIDAAAKADDAILMITADHGNSEDMVLRSGGKPLFGDDGTPTPRTAHTLNPVPFIVANYDPSLDISLRPHLDDAGLGNIGSTLLHLFGLSPPTYYAPSLLSVRRVRQAYT